MRLEGEAQAKKAQEEADRELSLEAWRDVKAYLEDQREKVRRSLAWRIADASRKHEADLSHHREKMDALHRDLELKRLGWLDTQIYREEEKARSRKSIALRLESWRINKIAEEKEKAKQELIAEEDALQREQDREELLAAKLAIEMMEKRKNLEPGMIF